MAKKTYTLDLNGATTGSGGITAAVGSEQGLGWDYSAAQIEASLNMQASGYVVSGSGPFTIEQPETYGNGSVSVGQGTLDAAPILTVTQEWLPGVNVSVDDNTISETGGVSIITFAIAAQHSASIDVAFTIGGTATDDSDFTKSTTSPVTISSLETAATMSITATDDATFEPEETITVSLGSITGGEAGTASSVEITLSSDDAAPASGGSILLMGVG